MAVIIYPYIDVGGEPLTVSPDLEDLHKSKVAAKPLQTGGWGCGLLHLALGES